MVVGVCLNRGIFMFNYYFYVWIEIKKIFIPFNHFHLLRDTLLGTQLYMIHFIYILPYSLDQCATLTKLLRLSHVNHTLYTCLREHGCIRNAQKL